MPIEVKAFNVPILRDLGFVSDDCADEGFASSVNSC